MDDITTAARDLFVDLLAAVDWSSPWTWLVIVAAVMLLIAANR